MPSPLTNEEFSIITKLKNTGVPIHTAVLAVILVTREYARPEQELIDIIRQYPHLEDRHTAVEAVAELRRRGWMSESDSYDLHLIHQAPDLRDKLAALLTDPDLPTQLLNLRATLEANVKIVGPMKERVVYESFLELLASAQSEICLPMLATTPNLSAVPILQERARKGVKVRIILGSEKVVASIRGETIRAAARDAIVGWRNNAHEIQQMEVRISHRIEDMWIASCMTIDRRVLRFDIYDPNQQRSLQGVMLEVNSPLGLQLNLVSVFQHLFDDAWHRAEPFNPLGKLWWWLSRDWQWFAFLIFTLLTFFSKEYFWTGIFGSVAATFLITALSGTWSRIRAFIRQYYA
jgi:hypothetical protein